MIKRGNIMDDNKLTDRTEEGSRLKRATSGLEWALNFKSPVMKVLSVALMLFFAVYGAKFVIAGFMPDTASAVSENRKAEADVLKEKIVSLERKVNAVESAALNEVKCKTFNLERLAKASAAGSQIIEYVKRYEQSANAAIAKVREMLGTSSDADIRTVITYTDDIGVERRASISSLNFQKSKVAENGKIFLRTLLAKALKERPLPENVLLVEDAHSFNVPDDADMTDELASRMGYIKVKLPEVPTFSVIEVKQEGRAKQAGVKGAPKKPRSNKAGGKANRTNKSK